MDALGEDLSDTDIEEMIAEADRKGLGGVTYEGKFHYHFWMSASTKGDQVKCRSRLSSKNTLRQMGTQDLTASHILFNAIYLNLSVLIIIALL